MQLLTSYVDQFNQLMPNANLLIDEQTGALNMTRDATNELIRSGNRADSETSSQ